MVLDLDETLISYDMETKNYETRPYLSRFLKNVSKSWEVVVFTASIKDYADKILNEIDPQGYVSKRLYRDSCKKVNDAYVKDLTLLGADFSKTVIVDNLASNF